MDICKQQKRNYRSNSETVRLIASACGQNPLTRRQIASAISRRHAVGIWRIADRMAQDGILQRAVSSTQQGSLVYTYQTINQLID